MMIGMPQDLIGRNMPKSQLDKSNIEKFVDEIIQFLRNKKVFVEFETVPTKWD